MLSANSVLWCSAAIIGNISKHDVACCGISLLIESNCDCSDGWRDSLSLVAKHANSNSLFWNQLHDQNSSGCCLTPSKSQVIIILFNELLKETLGVKLFEEITVCLLWL